MINTTISKNTSDERFDLIMAKIIFSHSNLFLFFFGGRKWT